MWLLVAKEPSSDTLSSSEHNSSSSYIAGSTGSCTGKSLRLSWLLGICVISHA